ncbi:MAG: single-stranded DNA-binding protein [Coriobacteriales bacterium]
MFIDCAIFGNRAEALAPYLVKGTKVALDGRLHYGQWEAEDGTRRSKLGARRAPSDLRWRACATRTLEPAAAAGVGGAPWSRASV